jgi:hypothetical protein
MSYTYLLEQEAESSAESFADIPASVLSRLNLTHEKSYCSVKETESFQSFQYGTMSEPLTVNPGAEKSMSSAEDSHAKTSVALEKEQELTASEAVCGSTWRESSVKYCRDSSSWKTHQCLWEEVSPSSSLTLPKWGMMRNGVLWERITPAPLTSGTESGSSESWATPTTMDKLPPKSADGIRKPHSKTSGRPITTALADAVVMWPTPTCHMAKEQDSPTESTRNTPSLTHLARGGDKTQPRHLNPTWVEWLMGWPLGWTDLKPLGTGKFRQWLHSHGEHLAESLNHDSQI